MSSKTWTAVDDYIVECAVRGGSRPRRGAGKANRDQGLPAIDVSPAQGKLLSSAGAHAAARRTILEIGTLGGYSTIWLARALAGRTARS